MRTFLTTLSFAALLQGATPQLGQAAPAKDAKLVSRVVAYVPNWIDVGAFSKTIDYSKITHINIAFENPVDENGELTFNPQNDALITAAHANRVQVLISIGGGLASTDVAMNARYANLLSDDNRAQFVEKLAAYVVQHNFDGLDVDLEGPAIGKDYGAFIQQLSQRLQSQGKLLTAALSQGYGGNQVPAAALQRFDWVNIMAYDGSGPWNPGAPGQHSSLPFAKSNVDYWLRRGLPKKKAVLGVPFYGYGFGESFRSGEYPYSAILTSYPGASQRDQVGNTIWYNGIPTIKAKARYAQQQGLGGIMIWSLDADVKGENSLLTAISEVLKR